MITSKTSRTADTANWPHHCFLVTVGTDFTTYSDVMQWAMQDEINTTGTGGPSLDPVMSSIFNGGASATSPLPVYFSKRKCRDTSLGGNDAINPLPQFCRDDDIGHPHYFSELDTGYSVDSKTEATVEMGQVYSEVFDDHQQILYLAFGIPVFNNLAYFYSNAVNQNLADFMNKSSGMTMDALGRLIGNAAVSLITMPVIPLKFLNYMLNKIQLTPITRYYDFAARMPMYFRFVNTILIHIATNMSFLSDGRALGSDEAVGSVSSGTTEQTLAGGTQQTEDLSGLSTVFSEYGLDMARIMAKRFRYEQGDQSIINRWTDDYITQSAGIDDTGSGANAPSGSAAASGSANQSAGADDSSNARTWMPQWLDSFVTGYETSLYNGHMYIGFRIEKGLDTSETFSNTTGESTIAQTLNQKFDEGRQMSMSTMNGHFAGAGILGSILQGTVDGFKGLLQGASDALHVDALAATMTGAAKIDIPEVWMNSSYSKSVSFEISCMAPYGDFESIFQSEYVPFACLLAGTLPRATGQSSYTSPFLCQAYCRGAFSSPLAMITDLHVQRGDDQFGWTPARLPLKMVFNVTLKDLSPVMYMAMGDNEGIWDAITGNTDVFHEYLTTVSGMGLAERVDSYQNLKRKAHMLLSTLYKNKLSPFQLGMEGGDRFLISRAISTILPGTGLPTN